jgi:hypothetical protein
MMAEGRGPTESGFGQNSSFRSCRGPCVGASSSKLFSDKLSLLSVAEPLLIVDSQARVLMSFAIDPALAGPSTSRHTARAVDDASSDQDPSDEYTSEEQSEKSQETDAEDEYEEEYGEDAAVIARDKGKGKKPIEEDIEIPVRFV